MSEQAAIKRICVFCGAAEGVNPQFKLQAQQFAAAMVAADIELVYGGGRIGLMGVIADAMLALGGRVTGIIPDFLFQREVGHTGLTELVVVQSMHERKAKMASLADAFVALPGGVGTLEEFVEVITWSLLGLHKKPCAILNTDGYYDLLVQFLRNATEEGFLAARHYEMILVETSPQTLLERLQTVNVSAKEAQFKNGEAKFV